MKIYFTCLVPFSHFRHVSIARSLDSSSIDAPGLSLLGCHTSTCSCAVWLVGDGRTRNSLDRAWNWESEAVLTRKE